MSRQTARALSEAKRQDPKPLSKKIVRSFKCAACFKEKEDGIVPYNHLDYHLSGQYLVASSSDTVSVFDAVAGTRLTRIRSKTTGTKFVRYTHAPDAVLFCGADAETGEHENRIVHYVNLRTNQFVRHFKGHEANIINVTKIHMANDTFCTTDEDAVMKLWDLRGPKAVGSLDLKASKGHRTEDERLYVAQGSKGSCFAVVQSTGLLRLYDSRNAALGPFDQSDLAPALRRECGDGTTVQSIHLSPNDEEGGDIIFGTSKDHLMSICPKKLEFQYLLQGRKKKTPNVLPVALSPDGAFVVAASEMKHTLPKTYKVGGGETESQVYEMVVWSLKKRGEGRVMAKWSGTSLFHARAMEWNPRYQSFASACCAVKFFCPSL